MYEISTHTHIQEVSTTGGKKRLAAAFLAQQQGNFTMEGHDTLQSKLNTMQVIQSMSTGQKQLKW